MLLTTNRTAILDATAILLSTKYILFIQTYCEFKDANHIINALNKI